MLIKHSVQIEVCRSSGLLNDGKPFILPTLYNSSLKQYQPTLMNFEMFNENKKALDHCVTRIVLYQKASIVSP
jgi:hypothetical protein